MIVTVSGARYARPSAPSGSSCVSAASGPYAADASASRPSSGTPASEPMRSRACSRLASGRPKSRSPSERRGSIARFRSCSRCAASLRDAAAGGDHHALDLDGHLRARERLAVVRAVDGEEAAAEARAVRATESSAALLAAGARLAGQPGADVLRAGPRHALVHRIDERLAREIGGDGGADALER